MQYHPEDFIALSMQVEAEGGKLLIEPCSGTKFRLKQPEAGGKMKWRRFQTTHCDQSALMELPYDPGLHVRLHDGGTTVVDHPGEDFPGGPVKVCAVDDAVGLMPRFVGVVSDRSYQLP